MGLTYDIIGAERKQAMNGVEISIVLFAVLTHIPVADHLFRFTSIGGSRA